MKYVTVLIQLCLLRYHLPTLTTKLIIFVYCVYISVIYIVLYYGLGYFLGCLSVYIYIYIYIYIHGATAPSGPGPPHFSRLHDHNF
jgi:hypothetical protein